MTKALKVSVDKDGKVDVKDLVTEGKKKHKENVAKLKSTTKDAEQDHDVDSLDTGGLEAGFVEAEPVTGSKDDGKVKLKTTSHPKATPGLFFKGEQIPLEFTEQNAFNLTNLDAPFIYTEPKHRGFTRFDDNRPRFLPRDYHERSDFKDFDAMRRYHIGREFGQAHKIPDSLTGFHRFDILIDSQPVILIMDTKSHLELKGSTPGAAFEFYDDSMMSRLNKKTPWVIFLMDSEVVCTELLGSLAAINQNALRVTEVTDSIFISRNRCNWESLYISTARFSVLAECNTDSKDTQNEAINSFLISIPMSYVMCYDCDIIESRLGRYQHQGTQKSAYIRRASLRDCNFFCDGLSIRPNGENRFTLNNVDVTSFNTPIFLENIRDTFTMTINQDNLIFVRTGAGKFLIKRQFGMFDPALKERELSEEIVARESDFEDVRTKVDKLFPGINGPVLQSMKREFARAVFHRIGIIMDYYS